MKPIPLLSTRLLGLGALLAPLLTACPPVPPPPTSPTFVLRFNYPLQADISGLTLAAYTFSSAGKLTVVNGYGGYPGSYNTYSASTAAPMKALMSPPVYPSGPSSLYLGGYALDSLLSAGGTNCTAFRRPADPALGTLTATPADVKTCYVYFVAYLDSNRNGRPDLEETVYMTHDVLGYADKAFTYSGASANGKISSTGSVQGGWTVLRHRVLQPSGTPGQYKVSMESVPTDDQGVAIQLHEPTPFLTSMTLPGLNAGGVK